MQLIRTTFLALALLLGGEAFAAFGIFQVSSGVPSDGWRVLPVGGGGNVSGSSIANDGTMFIRADVYGGYKWNASATSPAGTAGAWQQLITSASMPSTFVAAPQFYNAGIYEIAVAPSNSSIVYMVYNVFAYNTYPATMSVYKSTDGGATWALTGFTPVVSDTGGNNAANDSYRNYGPKMAVDPNDPQKLTVGVPGCSLSHSANGGTSFSSVTGPPSCSGTPTPGVSGLVYNPQNSNMLYVVSYGGGVYQTTTGPGGTWTHLTTGTGPTNVFNAQIDGAANGGNSCNGYYYAVDTSFNLWRWDGSTWSTRISGNSTQTIAVDPNTSGHLVAVSQSGKLNESNDCGQTWSGYTSGTPTLATGTGDVGWINTNSVFSLDAYGDLTFFDRSVARTLYTSSDKGFYTTSWAGSIATGTTVTWTSMARGIEEMVGNDVVVPPGGKPVVAAWDFGAFYKANNTAFSTTPNSNVNDTAGFAAAWSIDYAAGTPTFMAILADGAYIGLGQGHQKSSDGGQTWSPYTPPYSTSSGNIAVSTPNNWIFDQVGLQPYYTLNGAASWNAISLPGVVSWTGIGAPGIASSPRWIVADRVNANQFTIMFNGVGFFKTTDGGANWTKYANAAAGGFIAQIKSVPGQANNIWWSQSTGNAGNQPGGSDFQYSQDAGQTWTKVTNISTVSSVGFGKEATGQTYPAIYVSGWVKATSTSTVTAGTGSKSFTLSGVTGSTFNVGASVQMTGSGGQVMIGNVTGWSGGVLTVDVKAVNAGSGSNSSWTVNVFGVYRSIAGPSASSMVWTQLGVFPNNNLDFVTGISGDMSNWGYVYTTFNGSTAAWGYFNFLLKRDLDPALNDNDPMWLEKTA